MTELSLCLPYYVNPGMLARHYEIWQAWPSALKRQVEIVIVDDASPEGAAADVPRPEGLPGLSIYRVQKDVPWHQDGARNLGAHVAAGTWLLLTDMDHVLPAESAEALLKRIDRGRIDKGHIYTLERFDARTGRLMRNRWGLSKPHPNSFVVTRETYWHIGGYDEELCGVYGTDGAFRWRAFRKARRGHLRDVRLVRYRSDVIPDAATRLLTRKEGRTKQEYVAKERFQRSRRAVGFRLPVPVLTFEWERIF
jgi:hypothetical protein